MAQTNDFTIDANLTGTAFRTQTNEKLAALASSNLASTEPPNPLPGMLWFDSSNSRTHYLKLRNSQNNSWGIICQIDTQSGDIKVGIDTQELNKILSQSLEQKLDSSEKGRINGIATLDSNGKVQANQLPDISSFIFGSGTSSFPRSGASNKIYIDTSTNKIYRWSGSSYTQIAGERVNTEPFLTKNDATSSASANKVVKRDSNGSFSAKNITTQTLTLNSTNEDNYATSNSEIIFRNDDKKLKSISIEKLKELLNLNAPLSNPIIDGNVYVAGSVINTYGVTNVKPGATWQNVVSNRNSGVTYTNTTGYSILVVGRGTETSGRGEFRETKTIYLGLSGRGIRKIENGVWEVEPSGIYSTSQKITAPGWGNGISSWTELR